MVANEGTLINVDAYTNTHTRTYTEMSPSKFPSLFLYLFLSLTHSLSLCIFRVCSSFLVQRNIFSDSLTLSPSFLHQRKCQKHMALIPSSPRIRENLHNMNAYFMYYYFAYVCERKFSGTQNVLARITYIIIYVRMPMFVCTHIYTHAQDER